MISRNFVPFIFAENFRGVNSKDSQENMLDSEWDESSINIFSDPQGALGSRPGFTAITTASIGSATAWCGFYQFDTHSAGATTNFYLGGGSNGKLYSFVGNAYVEISAALSSITANSRFSFFTLNNECIIATGPDNLPRVYTGSGSVATWATSVTADFGIEWQRYGWLHSTVDPRLLYYSTLGDATTAYTNFLNFDMDGEKVTGIGKQSDDMIVGKQSSLYRVQYRGSTPLFKIYKIAAKVGPVNHFTIKELPDGTLMFLGSDLNFHMLNGDSLAPVGDNIKKVIKDGVRSRIQYAVAGLLYDRSQYWCSFTYISGATQNDRTVVMDWSRPYTDKWGLTQYPWFIYTIPANAFAEVTVSGQTFLYHGGYVGKVYKDNTGTNDDGSTFINSYVSKNISHGDPSLEKKYSNMQFAFENKGDWNLDISLVLDGNANTQKIITENMLGGLTSGAPRFDDGISKFDEVNFSSESDADVSREIMRQGKLIQITMGTDGLDEAWLIYNYTIHAKPLRRGIRVREGSA